MYWLGYDRSPPRLARSMKEARAALRLAPDLPQAHVAMGGVLSGGGAHRDLRRPLEEYLIALKELPNDAGLWYSIGKAQRRLGNWGEVARAFEMAEKLDPPPRPTAPPRPWNSCMWAFPAANTSASARLAWCRLHTEVRYPPS